MKPHKYEFRMQLIEQLKKAGLRETDSSEKTAKTSVEPDADLQALSKL